MLTKSVARTLSADDIHTIYAVTGLAYDRGSHKRETGIRYTSLESSWRPRRHATSDASLRQCLRAR